MEIPNKPELRKTAINHLPGINFKEFMKLCKKMNNKDIFFFLSTKQFCHQVILYFFLRQYFRKKIKINHVKMMKRLEMK